MRRWLTILGAVLVFGAACWAWPLVEVAELARAARSGDTTDVVGQIDVERLRRSLSRQIATAYLDATGRGRKLGSFGRSLAGAAATTVADPYVAELLTPENITALLAQGRVNRVKLGQQTISIGQGIPSFPSLLAGNWLSVVTGSYYDQLTDFVVPVNGGHGAEDQYGIHMHLDGLAWKLGGLDLPPAMIDEMARSILAGEKQPA